MIGVPFHKYYLVFMLVFTEYGCWESIKEVQLSRYFLEVILVQGNITPKMYPLLNDPRGIPPQAVNCISQFSIGHEGNHQRLTFLM